MKELLTKLTKLLDVKSIMTLSLTVGFLVLVNNGSITGQEFMTVYTTIVGFYFGVQISKDKGVTR